MSVPPTGPEHSDAYLCGRCTRWQVVYIQTGSFSRVCSGTSVHYARGVAASFLTRCRLAVSSSLSLRRLWLRVAAQASRTSHSRCFCSSDVEASCITPCRGRRVPFSERRRGVIVCLQSPRRQCVLHLFHDFSFRSDFCSTYYRSCVESIKGPRSKAQGCLISRPGTRLPQVKSTRLLDFQTGTRLPEVKGTMLDFHNRHKVA